MKRRITRIVFALAILMLITAQPAYALDEPTSVSVDDALIFDSLLTEDDALFVVPFTISYTTEPDVDISDTYIFRIIDSDGNEIASAIANPAYNSGYGSNMVSFYIEEGIVWEGDYTIRVQQNPAYYPAALTWDFATSISNWSSADDQTAALKAKIITIATSLTPSFGVVLLASNAAGSTILSTYGELYFLESIPGLQSMCPALFEVQLEDPDYTKRTWSTTLADTLQTKYSGTFIYDAMTGYAGLFSMNIPSAMNFLSVIAFVALIALACWKWKASMLSAFVDGYTLLLLLMLTGFFSMIWAGFMAFASMFIGGVILFLNRA